MNQSETSQGPNLNLPPTVIENEPNTAAQNSLETMPNLVSNETMNQAQESALGTQKVQSLALPDDFKIDVNQSNVDSTTTNIVAPATADDNDLIEKEWVIKAKKIIEDNRDNPYNQSREMTLFKADYMKKRYNKIIKISD